LNGFKADESQRSVIEAQSGEHLVLAPPGCGKTHILTERIRVAHERGVEYGDMLCLTFTNRAARSMRERIRCNIDDRGVDAVYVGNVHRFCSRFLFEYALVPAETSVIDDDDIISIVARFMGEEEHVIASSFRRRRECFDAVHLSSMMHQIEHRHPKELRVHPECLSKNDIAAIRCICNVQGMLFTPSSMAEIYRDARGYRDIVKGEGYLTEWQPHLMDMLRKMEVADYYDCYKKENRLIDFGDLLLLTYDALVDESLPPRTAADYPYKLYSWCQVDEVQDLNPLQMKIVDLLMKDSVPDRSMMFLGDEQQAIFSFMGAKMSTLEQLKRRCEGNIHHLSVNHRSPHYLLDVFNAYASGVLGIDSSFLPDTDFNPSVVGNELSIMCSRTLEEEYCDVAQQALRLQEQNSDETTAVIVAANSDADIISARMDSMSLRHFKVSGTDMFSLPEVKLLLAHMSVFANEHNFIAWARLLKGLHIYEQNASARQFVRQLFDRSLLPTDLMLRPGSSYVIDFARAFEEREIVVFDTETTGLDVCEDDILQIAAVKMRGGEVVPGSEFSVYIETERPIPSMLGNIVNPIVEERKHHKLLSHEDALAAFMQYVGSSLLLGHNADYDYNILDNNLKRYLPDTKLASQCPEYYDSLKLTRLLEPQLHQYKLTYLLRVLSLEGVNSHLADADVAATVNVVKHCYRRAQEVIPHQLEFLEQRTVKDRAADMRKKMLPLYRATHSRLHKRQPLGEEALLAVELRNFYSYLEREAIIQPVRNVEYMFRYISHEIVDPLEDHDLMSQIASHILELSTLKESDLCTTDIVEERVFVSTVHKTKGLEFDNVIVFDVNDDRYPSFFAKDDPVATEEDARKLYVALTRARHRILITLSAEKRDRHNQVRQRDISRFMKDVLPYFNPNNKVE
jgi:DNA helicase II / ATP-dependent DNA helicase PcrA